MDVSVNRLAVQRDGPDDQERMNRHRHFGARLDVDRRLFQIDHVVPSACIQNRAHARFSWRHVVDDRGRAFGQDGMPGNGNVHALDVAAGERGANGVAEVEMNGDAFGKRGNGGEEEDGEQQ
jgi:hypothetical protein